MGQLNHFLFSSVFEELRGRLETFADRVNWLLQGHGKSAAGSNVQRERIGVQGVCEQVEEGLGAPSWFGLFTDNFSPLRTDLGLRYQHHEVVFNKNLIC